MGVSEWTGLAGQLAVRAARAVSSQILTATDGRDVLANSPDGWEVEQPWLWWMGPAGGNGSGGPFGNPIPGSEPWWTFASIPAVGRATSLIVNTLAGLPWRVLRGTERLPEPAWLADPQMLRPDGRVMDPGAVDAARWSRMDVRTQWLTSALWFGDGYIYVPNRDATGAPAPPLFVLHPLDVKIEKGVYSVEDVELPASNLIHLRGLEPIVDGHGSGVFRRFAAELGLSLTMRDYESGVFTTGVPAGYLKVTAPGLAQDMADGMKQRWLDAHGGSRRSIAVLNATTEFHPLSFTPVDAALIEAMRANLLSVANAMGVPPDMIGAPTDANTYANVESRRLDFSTYTLLPWASRIEAVLDAQFPVGTSIKVALDGLIRADTKTQMEALKLAVDTGLLTVNEARELLDRPPLPASEQPEEVAVG